MLHKKIFTFHNLYKFLKCEILLSRAEFFITLSVIYFSSKNLAVIFITVNDLEAIIVRQIIKKLG